MEETRYRDWRQFHRNFLLPYAEQGRERQRQLLFRGHGDRRWELTTALDRFGRFTDDSARGRCYLSLLTEFRSEAVLAMPGPTPLPDPDALAFELLARHHGIPSPIMDWSRSPYVAAFFAFDGSAAEAKSRVSIWVFDRERFDSSEGAISLIDRLEEIRFNRRALQQRGSFTRINTVREPVATLLAPALTLISIPTSSRALALAELDVMGINATNLYADLDGAARTARGRVIP